MKTLLKIENIKKNFGKTSVLKGIDLEIKEGEIISVLGPSGCGKSTLLRIIAGILPLDEGCVYIRDNIVSSAKVSVATEKRDINMVFQDFALWPHMKVKDNILYGLKIKKLAKEEMENRLEELVALLRLEGLMDRYPAELSGGQQQRVAIARALITKPTIVLLDEPLCNLDIQLRVEMRTEMAYLFHKLGTTVFHVTHDPSEAFAMADRIIVMDQGRIDQIDTPMNCYKSPMTKTVAGLLGASNKVKGTVEEKGNTSSVQVGSHLVKCKIFSETVECNKNVILRFRPESVKFGLEKSENALPAKVTVSTFEGGCYRVKAVTETGDGFYFIHSEELVKGTEGYVEIEPDVLYAYEE